MKPLQTLKYSLLLRLQLNHQSVLNAFDGHFAGVCRELAKCKQQLEEKEISLRPILIDLYRLYCTSLPAAPTLYQYTADKKAQILHELESTRYGNIVYQIPSQLHAHNKLQSPRGWVFLNYTLISQLQTEVGKYLSTSHSTRAMEFDINIINTILRSSQLDSPLVTLANWLSAAKSRLLATIASNPATNSKWMDFLPALHKILHTSPEMLAKLVHLKSAFHLLHECATSFKLTNRLPTIRLIRECTTFVTTKVIHPCNEELRALGLAFTKPMKGYFHELMLQYLVTSQANYLKQQIDKAFKQFSDPELISMWRADFVEQALVGPKRDVTAANRLAKSFEHAIKSICQEESQHKLHGALRTFSRNHTRFKMQCEVECNLMDIALDELIKYIEDPPTYIHDRVNTKLEQYKTELQAEIQKVYSNNALGVRELVKWLCSIEFAPQNCSKANDIFSPEEEHVHRQGLLAKKEQAAAWLVRDLVCGLPRHFYTVDGIPLQVVARLSASELQPLAVQYANILLEGLKAHVYSISDIQYFLNALKECLVKTADQLDAYQSFSIDTGNATLKVLENARGCVQLCPCCMRCCDEDHAWTLALVGLDENRHKCRLGHQYRALAYVNHHKKKIASLQLCQTMNDTDMIWFDNQYIKWCEVKAKFPEWDFSPRVVAGLGDVDSRMAYIWRRVGRQLSLKNPHAFELSYRVIY
jgi:hypothetical protein